jgi:hypothetical protein
MNLPKRNYETLDAIVVIGAMLIVGGGVAGLIFFIIPSENLAVVAGLLGTIAGTILGGYAGVRWGASVANKDAQPVKVTNSPADPVHVEETKPTA